MITKKQKQEIVKDLTDKFSQQKAVVFSDHTGLKVSQAQDLRNELREEQIDYQVAKKTLIDLALKKAGFDKIKAKDLPGQLALAFSYQDEVTPAKILYNFSKKNKVLEILAGLVQGEYLEKSAIINLAKLPSKQEMLGRIVGSVSSLLYGLTNVLEGNLRKLIFTLKQIKQEA